jgi:hypothetical protein
MSLQEDIKKYVADNMENAFDLAKAFQMSKDLVLYGETHAGLEKKARFFARLINAKHVRYHASEHFLNTKEYGDKVTKYLKGEISKSGLPSGIRPLAVILDAIKIDIKTRGIVFAGTTVKNSERRHERLHYHFTSSYNLNIKEGRFTKTDKGHFHIGAFHAARLPQQGSAKTTTQLLTDDGFDCGVVRILVDYGGTASVGRQGMTVVPGE